MMVTISAPAKLNLFLHVTGKRSDGYHDLQSLIFFTDIADSVTVKTAEENTLTASGPFAHQLPDARYNLAWRAMQLLQEAAPPLPAFSIHIEKYLPVASGIGGGSADAAAVLRAIVQLQKPKLASERMTEILLALGAEMPVCYQARTAMVQGKGEWVEAWPPLPDLGILLVNPNQGLLTKDVFAELKMFSAIQLFEKPGTINEWSVLWNSAANDLLAPACKLLPEISEMLKVIELQSECMLARMSGSGPTCFGIFTTRKAAVQVAESIQQQYPQWWVKAGGIYGA